MAATAKNVNKNVPVIVFGQHPSARPEACLNESNSDFVVLGEPENTVSERVDALEQGRTHFMQIEGLGFKVDGNIVLTGKRAVIEDLDALPFPARHLLPMEAYYEAVRELPLRGEIRKPWTIMITSRGCPYNCVFCTNCIVSG